MSSSQGESGSGGGGGGANRHGHGHGSVHSQGSSYALYNSSGTPTSTSNTKKWWLRPGYSPRRVHGVAQLPSHLGGHIFRLQRSTPAAADPPTPVPSIFFIVRRPPADYPNTIMPSPAHLAPSPGSAAPGDGEGAYNMEVESREAAACEGRSVSTSAWPAMERVVFLRVETDDVPRVYASSAWLVLHLNAPHIHPDLKVFILDIHDDSLQVPRVPQVPLPSPEAQTPSTAHGVRAVEVVRGSGGCSGRRHPGAGKAGLGRSWLRGRGGVSGGSGARPGGASVHASCSQCSVFFPPFEIVPPAVHRRYPDEMMDVNIDIEHDDFGNGSPSSSMFPTCISYLKVLVLIHAHTCQQANRLAGPEALMPPPQYPPRASKPHFESIADTTRAMSTSMCHTPSRPVHGVAPPVAGGPVIVSLGRPPPPPGVLAGPSPSTSFALLSPNTNVEVLEHVDVPGVQWRREEDKQEWVEGPNVDNEAVSAAAAAAVGAFPSANAVAGMSLSAELESVAPVDVIASPGVFVEPVVHAEGESARRIFKGVYAPEEHTLLLTIGAESYRPSPASPSPPPEAEEGDELPIALRVLGEEAASVPG
ncbi:hypothetical protein B0H14DRAFT_3441938 [Mycena olivaceomarginata]|nr:hypothetical protein B0H14DRAFT_3441938 [Mycena olivaceomarginata]